MTTTIGVLRMTGATRVRAEAAAAALGLAADGHDRSVLIVRRLRVAAGDRDQARAELASARECAARPSLGLTDLAAAAVLFADEAEMLACLTRDVAAGRRPWYWRHVLPPDADTGAALAAVWIARVRWLPAALALLAAGETVAAARLIGPAPAGRVLAALAAEFGMTALPPDRVADQVAAGQGGDEGVDRAGVRPAAGTEPDPAGHRLAPAAGAPAPVRPAPGLPAVAGGLPPAARILLAACMSLGGPARLPGRSRPEPDESRPLLWPASQAGSRGRQEAAGRPAGSGPAGGGRVAAQPARAPQRAAAEPDPRAGTGSDRPEPPRFTAAHAAPDGRCWDPAVSTSIASALYVVNLLGPGWLAIPRPGWATVEQLARHVLGGLLDEAEDDPLWEMLAVLDEREPGTAAEPPPRFARVTGRADALCAAHELDAAAFGHPGRIALTRTHLDVLLALDEVDLAARRCGIDQDPGWVPSLRRIVAFHFLGGTELVR